MFSFPSVTWEIGVHQPISLIVSCLCPTVILFKFLNYSFRLREHMMILKREEQEETFLKVLICHKATNVGNRASQIHYFWTDLYVFFHKPCKE